MLAVLAVLAPCLFQTENVAPRVVVDGLGQVVVVEDASIGYEGGLTLSWVRESLVGVSGQEFSATPFKKEKLPLSPSLSR